MKLLLLSASFSVSTAVSASSLFGIPFEEIPRKPINVCKFSEIGSSKLCAIDKPSSFDGVKLISLNTDESKAPAWAAYGKFTATMNKAGAIDTITVETQDHCKHNDAIASISSRFGPPVQSQVWGPQGGWQASWDRKSPIISLMKSELTARCYVTFKTPAAAERSRLERAKRDLENRRPLSP